MSKITPRSAPMRSWLIALLIAGCFAALLGIYAATTPEGIDSILDLLAT